MGPKNNRRIRGNTVFGRKFLGLTFNALGQVEITRNDKLRIAFPRLDIVKEILKKKIGFGQDVSGKSTIC